MTLDEAKKVAMICAQADGGCPCCVGSHADALNEVFPEYVWTYDSEGPHTLKVFYGPDEDDFTSYRPIDVTPK